MEPLGQELDGRAVRMGRLYRPDQRCASQAISSDPSVFRLAVLKPANPLRSVQSQAKEHFGPRERERERLLRTRVASPSCANS